MKTLSLNILIIFIVGFISCGTNKNVTKKENIAENNQLNYSLTENIINNKIIEIEGYIIEQYKDNDDELVLVLQYKLENKDKIVCTLMDTEEQIKKPLLMGKRIKLEGRYSQTAYNKSELTDCIIQAY